MFANIPVYNTLSSLRKQPTFCDATNGFPAKWHLRNDPGNSIMMTRHYPDLGSASIISRAAHEICFNQSVALPRSGWSRFISMEFLCWFLRRHFTRKIVMASQNVVCFLRPCTWLCYRSGQIKFGLKFFNLGWLSFPVSPSPNYSWIRARRQHLLRINLQSATKLLLLICYSNRLNYGEQKKPHPSPSPSFNCFL